MLRDKTQTSPSAPFLQLLSVALLILLFPFSRHDWTDTLSPGQQVQGSLPNGVSHRSQAQQPTAGVDNPSSGNPPAPATACNHGQVAVGRHSAGDSANSPQPVHKRDVSDNTRSKFSYQKKRPHCSDFVQVEQNFLCLLVVTAVFIVDTELLLLQKQRNTLFFTYRFHFN